MVLPWLHGVVVTHQSTNVTGALPYPAIVSRAVKGQAGNAPEYRLRIKDVGHVGGAVEEVVQRVRPAGRASHTLNPSVTQSS